MGGLVETVRAIIDIEARRKRMREVSAGNDRYRMVGTKWRAMWQREAKPCVLTQCRSNPKNRCGIGQREFLATEATWVCIPPILIATRQSSGPIVRFRVLKCLEQYAEKALPEMEKQVAESMEADRD